MDWQNITLEHYSLFMIFCLIFVAVPLLIFLSFEDKEY